jgi:hypothetical protein
MNTKTKILNLWKDHKKTKADIKQIKQDAIKEADSIFVKTQPGIAGTDNYPKITQHNYSDSSKLFKNKAERQNLYGRRYNEVLDQVQDVRIQQYKDKKKNK